MAHNFPIPSWTYIPLNHGKCRVYKSPLSNLVIAFTQEELDEVELLLAQIQLLTEARQLVKGKYYPHEGM